MPGMLWNANHVLHLALKQETETIPAEYFEKAKGILLVNVVEVGLIIGAGYGTGILLAKTKADDDKWSPPCAIGLKSLGVGSLGTAVRDVIIFLFDEQSVENLASNNRTSLKMEHKGRATLGPLGRHDTHVPHVSSESITTCAAFSFAKGALVGVTGETVSVYPSADANTRFYKTKKQKDITPQDILSGSVKVPASANKDTLLPDVYQKLDMLTKGAKYDGTEKLVSRPSVTKAVSTASMSSSSRSGPEKRPSVTKQASTKKPTNGASARTSVTKSASNEKRPSVTKQASTKKPANGASARPSVTKSASVKSSGATSARPSINKTPSEKRPSVTKAPSEKRPSITKSPERRPSTKATNPPVSPKSVTKVPVAESPNKQAPRPSPAKQPSKKPSVKPAASRRPSVEIKGYNC